MESVVKAVGLPVNFSDEVKDDTEEKKDDKSPPSKYDNSRKRRHSSDEEYRSRERKDHYEVGSRYWGDEGSKSLHRNRSREQDHHSTQRGDHQKNDNRKNLDPILANEEGVKEQRKTKEVDPIMTRTGGAYIPPARLRMMQAQITDKSSLAYQRLAWEALKKSIHGLINKINVANIRFVVSSLFKENIVRGRGLLTRSIIQAQAASPTFTHVYAALAALINTKFPNIGELVLTRLILQFRRGFRRNDKDICMSSTRFIAHLVNQQVAHELLALEILTLLLENATDDSVEVAVGFLKECGQKLGEVSPRGLTAVFDRLRHVLHEAELDKRIKYMIEVMFQVRKDGFKDNPTVVEELDLVEEEDQFTHLMSIEEEKLDPQDLLNVFKQDPEYEANEEKYRAVKIEIIGDDSGEGDSPDEEDGESSEESGSEEEAKEGDIVDETETNLIALRRTIYLTIQSSLDHNECAHKMMKMQMKPGQETELCHMILDCCTQQRTYEKFYGLLAQRFCQINKAYVPPFEQIFHDTYETIHRLDTNKLRNVGKLFAHLLFTDAISWQVMANIRLTEEDTTSSSRIFLKILFQELSEYVGLSKLNLRLKDPTLQTYFEGIFPRDDPRNTRFAINFFTSIGLGGLTDELREHLRTHPKPPPITVPAPVSTLSAAAAQLLLEDSDSDSSSASSSSSSSSSSTATSSSSSSDEGGKNKVSRKKPRSLDSKSKPEIRSVRNENTEEVRPKDQRPDSRQRDRSHRDDKYREQDVFGDNGHRRDRNNDRVRSDPKYSDKRERSHDKERSARKNPDDGARRTSDDTEKNRRSRHRRDYEEESRSYSRR